MNKERYFNIRMIIKDKEYREYMQVYLEDYYKIFEGMTIEQFNYFKGLNINNNKSYYVMGDDTDDLRRFACFYLMIKEKRFKTYTASAYAENPNKEEGEFLESEVIILYNHRYSTRVGGGESFVWGRALDKMTIRNRDEKTTIFLTERDIPFLRKSNEFIVLDLNNKSDPKNFKSIGKDTVAESEKILQDKYKNMGANNVSVTAKVTDVFDIQS